ncbi:MAG: CDP-alcohol phosphatidyltransferase family protein [Planctomycetota bacterium]
MTGRRDSPRVPEPTIRRTPELSVRNVPILPNLITLANAFCGLLALAKGVDALAFSQDDPAIFYRKLQTACMLIFLGMVFDSLDGLVARLTRGASDFGAQLDSFSDALTFGVAPAILGKILIDHEAGGHGRLTFLAAASFALMAILRLVRYNLEHGTPQAPEEKAARPFFRGLPSPAAAGAVASTIWLYLVIRAPELERAEGLPTPFGTLVTWLRARDWSPVLEVGPLIVGLLLPVLGLLMVSNVRYLHPVKALAARRTNFFTLVVAVFVLFLFYAAAVPFLFVLFLGFVLTGVVLPVARRLRGRHRAPSPPR